MQLIYRGVSYETQPSTVKPDNAKISAKYRGVSYLIHRSPAPLVPDSLVVLKYRGVSYIKFSHKLSQLQNYFS